MKEEYNVVSFFDGMSCGQLALKIIGVNPDNYYACEIDKYAIQVTQKNFPNTKQLGDVTKISGYDFNNVKLFLGGSPCQGFSFAGKQLNFEDPRSKLFFEYVRVLNELRVKNPDIKFILENVKMKKEYQDIISELLGVQPVEINSSLLSAQNRKRLYWTNIGIIEQPEDRGILLKDIIENGFIDRDKSFCLDANYFKGGNLKQYFEKSRRQLVFSECICVGEANLKGYDIIKRVYDTNGKSPALTTMQGGHREPKITLDKITWRKLTPLECERLQTVPDNYTEGVSNSQRYKMLGNGWTVDVIAHILSFYNP